MADTDKRSPKWESRFVDLHINCTQRWARRIALSLKALRLSGSLKLSLIASSSPYNLLNALESIFISLTTPCASPSELAPLECIFSIEMSSSLPRWKKGKLPALTFARVQARSTKRRVSHATDTGGKFIARQSFKETSTLTRALGFARCALLN